MRSAESVFIGSISDNVVDLCEGGQALLDRLTEVAPDALKTVTN